MEGGFDEGELYGPPGDDGAEVWAVDAGEGGAFIVEEAGGEDDAGGVDEEAGGVVGAVALRGADEPGGGAALGEAEGEVVREAALDGGGADLGEGEEGGAEFS